jgi:hypothetical protein
MFLCEFTQLLSLEPLKGEISFPLERKEGGPEPSPLLKELARMYVPRSEGSNLLSGGGGGGSFESLHVGDLGGGKGVFVGIRDGGR